MSVFSMCQLRAESLDWARRPRDEAQLLLVFPAHDSCL